MPNAAFTDPSASFEQPPEETVSTKPCPMCLSMNKNNPLRNRIGQHETYCSAGHKWADTEQLNFMVEQAKKIYPQAFPKPQVVKEVEPPNFFVVDPDNKIALEKLAGVPINGAAELKGILWTFASQAREANEALSKFKTQQVAAGMAADKVSIPGNDRFTLQIPEYLVGTIEDHANHEQKPVQTFLQEQFGTFLESYYSPLAAFGGGGR